MHNLAAAIMKEAKDDDYAALLEATKLMSRAAEAGSEGAKAFFEEGDEEDSD